MARVREDKGAYISKAPTSNVQRSTANTQPKGTRFNLEDRWLEFSARIIRLVDPLPNTRATNHVAGQLLRCGTSPYGSWLRLLQKAGLLPEQKMRAILGEPELIKIFFTGVRTAEKKSETYSG